MKTLQLYRCPVCFLTYLFDAVPLGQYNLCQCDQQWLERVCELRLNHSGAETLLTLHR